MKQKGPKNYSNKFNNYRDGNITIEVALTFNLQNNI